MNHTKINEAGSPAMVRFNRRQAGIVATPGREIDPATVKRWRVVSYTVEAEIDGKWHPAIDCAVRERHGDLWAKTMAVYLAAVLNGAKP